MLHQRYVVHLAVQSVASKREFYCNAHAGLMKPIIAGNETVVYAVLHLFGLCNALTNPILYGYLNENFRKEYKNIYRWEHSVFKNKTNTGCWVCGGYIGMGRGRCSWITSVVQANQFLIKLQPLSNLFICTSRECFSSLKAFCIERVYSNFLAVVVVSVLAFYVRIPLKPTVFFCKSVFEKKEN